MAKSRYKHNQEYFNQQVRDGKAKGLTDKQIFQAMGISKQTYYKYIRDFVDFADSHKKGTETLIEELENVLANRARGMEWEEVTTEIKTDQNGNVKEKHIKRVKKFIPPSETALIFMLSNLLNNKWKRNPDLKTDDPQDRADVEIK
jgi:transcriptional regulator with XRE-family HTH domain